MKGLTRGSFWLGLAWLLASAGIVRAQVVALPGEVQVSGERVRFSDLLPSGADDKLRRSSEAIDLGRAPRFGSVRVLEREWLHEMLNPHPEIVPPLVIPDRIMVMRSGYPLSSASLRSAVANYLREKGAMTDVPDSALQWSCEIATMQRNPALEVREVSWDASRRRFQFRVGCLKRQSCQDFIVYVQTDQEILRRATWAATGVNRPKATAPENGAILMAAGQKARLLMQGDGLHILMPVISLQNGRMGETIRVRAIGSAHVFRAQVVSSDLLWSELES
jgi:hypothetical protein